MTAKKTTRVLEARAKHVATPGEIARAIDDAEIVDDFLPPPQQLFRKEEAVMVTLKSRL